MSFKHVQYIDLEKNGLESECVILRTFENEDRIFIKLNELDNIDLERLTNIVNSRDAGRFELWDLMNSHTLRNGENALMYFHQMAKGITKQGTSFVPMSGNRGSLGVRVAAEPEKRGPGRPKNSN